MADLRDGVAGDVFVVVVVLAEAPVHKNKNKKNEFKLIKLK